jgi:type II secretory pathway component GspD/PulD (secretin)
MKLNKINTLLLLVMSSYAFAQDKNINLLPIEMPKIKTQAPIQNLNLFLDSPKIFDNKPKNPSFNLQEMPISQLMNFYFQEINTNNYVLSPDISKDDRIVSFRFDSKQNKNLAEFSKNLITSLGYVIENKSGVYFVFKKEDMKIKETYDIYKPKYRDTTYLLNLVRPIFGNNFSQIAQVQNPTGMPTPPNSSPTSAPAQMDSKTDILIFHSQEKSELQEINALLTKLDTEEKNLLVKASIYEVSFSDKDGSAIGLMLNLLDSKLNLNLGSASALDNVLKFSTNGLSILFSNIQTDSRFKLLSNPYLRIKNNQTSSLIVGQSVPTLGAISYQGTSGTPTQSVEYKDSGLLFKITPSIKELGIDIVLSQQISEVQNTTTGVNNSPTLTKRQLDTNFTTKKNEVVILAGLKQNKKSEATSTPFFMPFLSNKNNQIDNTEIIILLEVSQTDDKNSTNSLPIL